VERAHQRPYADQRQVADEQTCLRQQKKVDLCSEGAANPSGWGAQRREPHAVLRNSSGRSVLFRDDASDESPRAGGAEGHQLDTNGDQDAFLALIKRVEAIRERLGVPGTSRVWQATLAGEGTGSTFVAVEYPNLVAMAQSISKMGADEGWQQLVDDFQKAGMSVNSNSTSVEITP
jgi:hypothetical protein